MNENVEFAKIIFIVLL